MLDDGDEFDWVAAVAEIDAACDKAIKQSSIPASSSSSRQLTLDRFICKETKYEEDAVSASLRNHQIDPEAAKYEDAAAASLCNHQIDPETAHSWIYPEHPPVRDYQLSITKTALFQNTLVSLPTGLGKTLIAAVVIYNYNRWFPKGKIVFTAPSRPLVTQQIQACHNIVGISQERTVDLTGQTTPSKRASLWKEKQIFFVTPQVLEKDIQSGTCPVTQLVCLVIDEAHHASGNHSYCVAVRELMAIPVHLRILALTATPGGNHQTVQQVIDNLQISVLEYRSDSHPDVISYVHDRMVEVIEVEMGKEATEVNKLIMDVIRVYVKKLNDIGVLPKRDPQTMSPIDFINSREKFRQFPPQDLAEINYGEIEGSFAILMTLYHIRKLVSAHGIRSAFEMLEEKLKQGYFARLLSRNEKIHKAKVIMQQNLSHGSYSPKFSKLLEVLTEHFEKHDLQKSRVIIFSHFRESVRDIMSSIATIGEHVKAAEFVGQSSGKTSKGQSQKVQQAVLQKFRDGGYNVIVSTSIGEEGLDIMEVDLVICFDANISPLRMIQRMGRTGRKSKGRVVVLACEGIELNGYKRKQAKGKAVSKHMLNAGKSFLFHPSPRMVPHVFRPEIKLVTFSIEEFVPRGKKVKEDDAIQTPRYKSQLTDIETNLLEKYFDSAREENWEPSLIAFPHFQAFPSRVHKIAHSMRTTMLIDTMQYLQELSFNGQDEETSEECFKVENCNDNTREDELARREPETETKEKHHSFFFGSDFAAVDSNGSILILSVPVFPLKQFSPIKTSIPQNATLSLECSEEITLDVDVNEDDRIFQVNNPNDAEAGDLSPRLTNLVMSGVVPESPLHNRTSTTANGGYTTLEPDNTSVSLVQSKNDEVVTSKQEIRIPQVNKSIEKRSKFEGEIRTPLSNLSNKSCSKDWILSSGEKTVSQPKKKLKRLRKFCDINSDKEGNPSVSGNKSRPPLDHGFDKHGRGGRKLSNDARIFIDDEAEDSTEASDDEEFDNGEDSYGGSFIDDRINPTMATASPFDMMAIYRRSLLTQSPIINASPNNTVLVDEVYDADRSASTPLLHTNVVSSAHLNTSRLFSDTVVIPSTTSGPAYDAKRQKLTESGPFPICNLEKEMFLESEAIGKEMPRQMDAFDDDDEFFQGIDLDALEEQASKQLRSKSNSSNEKLKIKDFEFLDSPSFDLGI